MAGIGSEMYMDVLKAILLMLIFSTSTLIGVLISKKYSGRMTLLEDMKKALNIFEVKVDYSYETIPEIFSDIGKKFEGTISKIFLDSVAFMEKKKLSAGEAWEKSITRNLKYSKKEDIDTFISLGRLLGTTDVEGQVSQIRLVNKFIDQQIKEALTDKNKNEVMCKKLGAIIGLVLVIVLI